MLVKEIFVGEQDRTGTPRHTSPQPHLPKSDLVERAARRYEMAHALDAVSITANCRSFMMLTDYTSTLGFDAPIGSVMLCFALRSSSRSLHDYC